MDFSFILYSLFVQILFYMFFSAPTDAYSMRGQKHKSQKHKGQKVQNIYKQFSFLFKKESDYRIIQCPGTHFPRTGLWLPGIQIVL